MAHKAMATLPSPYPYYEVYLNRKALYLVVHVKVKGQHEPWDYQTWRVDLKTFEYKRVKFPVAPRPARYWQDYVDLKVIQTVYFDILDSYRADTAEVIELKPTTENQDAGQDFDPDDIPF